MQSCSLVKFKLEFNEQSDNVLSAVLKKFIVQLYILLDVLFMIMLAFIYDSFVVIQYSYLHRQEPHKEEFDIV